MEEDLAKMNAGGSAERITRRRKTKENDAGEEKSQWTPAIIALNGCVDWDRKMQTMMGSADARRLLDSIIESLLAHRRAVIDEEKITYSDMNERVHHLKVVIRIKAGIDEGDVWPIGNKILDMHRVEKTGWPGKLKVQVEVNPRKKHNVTEMGQLLRWVMKMSVTEYRFFAVGWIFSFRIRFVGRKSFLGVV